MVRADRMIADYLAAAESAGASRATLRQRRWALGLLLDQALALADGEPPGPGPNAGETPAPPDVPGTPVVTEASPVAEPRPVAETSPVPGTPPARRRGALTFDEFAELLPMAEARLVGSRPDTPIPTLRAWRASIRALSSFAGVAPEVPSLPAPVPRKVLTSEGVRALETLRRREMITLMPEEQARLAMVLALLATAPLTGTQLCGLRTGDLDDRLTTLTVTVAPRQWRRLDVPGSGQDPIRDDDQNDHTDDDDADESPRIEALPLPAYVTDAITRWLAVRSVLVQALRGRTDVLLVAVAANHDPRTSAVRPPGLPLKPRGLQRSFTRAALAANAELVGQPGFPLPTSLELARRSYHAWRLA